MEIKKKNVEYMCTYCGKKQVKLAQWVGLCPEHVLEEIRISHIGG